MDPRFHYFGFAANPSLIVSKKLGNSIPISGAVSEGGYCADTTLRLDSSASLIPSGPTPKGIEYNWSFIRGSIDQKIGSSLCLSLGHSSSSLESKWSSGIICPSLSSAVENDESSMDLEMDVGFHLGSEKAPKPKSSAGCNSKVFDAGPAIDLELSLSCGPAESDVATVDLTSISPQSFKRVPQGVGRACHANEASTGSHRKSGGVFHLSHALQDAEPIYFLNQAIKEIKPTPVSSDPSSSVITNPKSSVACSSGLTRKQQQRSCCIKQCQFKGCVKGARGASGLCIAHGGGHRCQKPGCHKGAEGRTAFCKAHGGGRRCEFLGCTKSAEGRTDFCIAHGGGCRCSHEGCTRAARGNSGLCIRHGGGKRCQEEKCTRSAEGLSGLCISHGGGRRCQYPQCTKGAQGSTLFCKAHGGGKRCTFEGCNKGAEGSTPFCKGHGGGKRCSFQGGEVCPKSVHGGTLFCVAHGGGKRCAVPECSRSARGRTDFCVRHGGGRRCIFNGCGKSAQGSTDFCKAHGGGKRCSWGQPGSEFGQNDSPCNSFAKGKTGLCASHGALVQDKCVHGGAALGAVVLDSMPKKPGKMEEVVNAEDMCNDILWTGSNILTFTNGSDWKYFGHKEASTAVCGSSSLASEGRVHGGSLMATLAGGSGHTSKQQERQSKSTVTSSEPGKPFLKSTNWM